MSSLFILGNGFDIAHGIKTQYSEFRKFLLSLYPNSLAFRDEIVYIENYKDLSAEEFAIEILLHTMDKMCGGNWSNFEDALAFINFNDKFPVDEHEENETDEEEMILTKRYLLYMDMLTSVFIKCSKLWQDLFRIWIKNIEKQIEEEQFVSMRNLEELFNSEDATFLTFNYTKTLQKLYGIKKVVHIHNRVGQKLIFGHGESNIIYNPDSSSNVCFFSSFLDNMIMSFKKDTASPLKKYNDFFKKLDQQITRVYSYGFSYGKVDSIYIKKIIEKINPNSIWYFTSYEANDKEGLRIKKIKLRKYGFKGEFGIY